MTELSSSSERFRRADALFDAALDLEPHERAAFVDRECAGDAELRGDVLRLLRAHDRSGDFLATPLPSIALSRGGGGMSAAHLERLTRAIGDAYAVEREIGAGGMATVYLAEDRKHRRPVALKVLRPELAAMLGVERFLAEIRVTASLQHPNLLPLFDSGEADGLLYYVMPYVDGESLRARLDRERQLPVGEAVRLATAIAGALDYAHRRGVVHRDLKPENVLLHEGQPLVADFGIALAVSRAGGARLTHVGTTLGTPQYMSPEQASGDRPVDARSDVYSLGCVLYEMLAGDPPHTASTVQSLLARVLTEEPRGVRTLRPTVPDPVAAAVSRALARLPADRFAGAREFADALASPATSATVDERDGGARRAAPRRPSHRAVALGAVAVVALLVSVALGLWARRRAAEAEAAEDAAAPTTRFVVGALVDPALGGLGTSPTITPDGRSLVYTGAADSGHPLVVRRLDELRGHALAGTEGAFGPFVSPDGRWVGYFTTDDKLAKVPIAGGTPTVLAGAFRFSDARWTAGDVIVTDAYGQRGLSWTGAGGGALHPLTTLDSAAAEAAHAAPLVLPDGRTVVFTIERQRTGPGPATGELAAVRLDVAAPRSPARHVRIGVAGRTAVAYVDGWLVYVGSDGASLLATRFDPERLRVEGAPVTVLEDPDGDIESAALADDGTLLYTRQRGGSVPVLVDARGAAAEPLVGAPSGSYMNPRFSPDGRRLLIQSSSPRGNDVWVYDLASRTPTQLTTTASAVGPTWTPDGRRVVFLSNQGGRDAFWWQLADGSAPAERIVEGDGVFAAAITPDGRTLLFQRQVDDVWGIWSASLVAGADRTPRPVLRERFDDYMPAVSPNGRWLAYASNATGRYEIYARPFPGPGAAVRVSEGGGTEPAWSPDGRRLYYRGGRRLIAATVKTVATSPAALAVTAREPLFADGFETEMPHVNYAVAPDGRHFAMVATRSAAAGPETVVVLNWVSELRRRLAAAAAR